MPGSSDLERLLAVEVLAAGLEMDRVVAADIVRIRVVVEGCGETDVHSTERVHHVAECNEIDRDVLVEREAGYLPDLMLGRSSAPVAPCVLLGDAADDVRVRHLVSGVDLVRPRPGGRVLEVHLDHHFHLLRARKRRLRGRASPGP